MLNPWLILGVVLAFGASNAVSYWYGGSVREAKIVAAQAKATEDARTKASKDKEAAVAVVVSERDAAIAELERVRAERPATLVKTVTRPVEVPSGAATVECPESRIGDDFVRLHNAAAAAYDAMSEASGGNDAPER